MRNEASELLRKVELYEREMKTIIDREKARVLEEMEILQTELVDVKQTNREQVSEIQELSHERDEYKLNFDHFHKESVALDKELQELKFNYNYLERDFKR